MIAMAGINPQDTILDIGSGDGRIIIAAGKAGAYAEGFEINPLLVLWSRRKIKKNGMQHRVKVHWQNFWFADFSKYDKIFIFGIPHIMDKIKNKLLNELKPGATVISNAFPLKGWDGVQDGYVYKYTKK